MKRIIVFFIFGCLVLCQGQRHHSHDQDDADCECDDDSGGHHRKNCECSSDNGKSTRWLCAIVIVSVIAVGMTAVTIGCCVYNKKYKTKKTKTHPEQNVTYITVSDPETNKKKPLPDNYWTGIPASTQLDGGKWTTMHLSAPPPYSTLPHDQPESRESVMSPPPPYTMMPKNF